MPVGPIILCAEKARKSTSSSRTSTGECGTSCAPSATTMAPAAWAAVGDVAHGGNGAENVGHARDTDSLDAVDQAVEVVEHQTTGAVDRDVPQVEPAELLGEDHPGHDVGVVLHLGQEHGIAGSQVGAAPGLGHQVERLRRVLGEDHLVRRVRRADEASGRHAGPLVQGGGLLGGGVDAAVHVGVRRLVVVGHGADDGPGLQRGGGGIEIYDRPAVHRARQQRKVLAQRLDVEWRWRGGRRRGGRRRGGRGRRGRWPDRRGRHRQPS